jgi:signal transduction histidine kinase
LTGNDELSELDKAFAEVAAERLKLEEIRKSMTAIVSHDLRSPLTAMTLTLELMVEMDGDNLPPRIVTKLKQLMSDSNRLCRLSNTLLDIEKIESGKVDVELRPISVRTVADSAISAISSLANIAEVRITPEIQPETMMLCDEDRTVQVLVNLLSNAIKFAPKQSSIEVRATQIGPDHVRVEVCDHGPGIRIEQQARLFSKFSQLDQPEEIKKMGSGLGLYICKTFITAQNGSVGVDSVPGEGTTFWFELPSPQPAGDGSAGSGNG